MTFVWLFLIKPITPYRQKYTFFRINNHIHLLEKIMLTVDFKYILYYDKTEVH